MLKGRVNIGNKETTSTGCLKKSWSQIFDGCVGRQDLWPKPVQIVQNNRYGQSQATNPTRYNLSPSYEYQENPWLAHYKREKRISFKAIAWMVLTVVGIYNKLMKRRKKVTILYGTETGKSKKFSKQAVNLFASLYRCTLLPLDHENLYKIMRSTHFITIKTMVSINNNMSS